MTKKDEKKAAETTKTAEELKAESAAEVAAAAEAEAARLQALSDADARVVGRYRVVMTRENPCGEGVIKPGEELGVILFTHPAAAMVTPLFLIHAVSSDLVRLEPVEPVEVRASEPSEAVKDE